MKWVSEDCSVVKGINFHTEKISPMHIEMQNVYASERKNGITFHPLHQKTENFRVCSAKMLYGWVSELAPWARPPGPWSGKGPIPTTQTSLWVLVLWDHDIPFWKPIGKPNTDFITDSYLIQFWLENRVEVCRAANGHQAVGVGELGEDTNLIVVLEVGSDNRHCQKIRLTSNFFHSISKI